MNRWEELAALKDGWLDGSGLAITSRALTEAKKVYSDKGQLRIYPTAQGGVLLENKHDSWEVHPDGTVETY